ncbi:MAG: ABC transporter permease [Candidatus Omnitrophota bacterium]|nr:ABC transporter permease [Candidatus Omnitrophota bacterium]
MNNNIVLFFRVIKKSFTQRKFRLFLALFALSIAACVVSALLSLYYDINLKMNRELRSYGANIVISPRDTGKADYFKEADLKSMIRSLDEKKLIGAIPYLYTISEINAQRVVLAGTWPDEIKKVYPYWKINGAWIGERGDKNGILVGYEVAKKLGLKIGEKIKLSDTLTSKTKEFVIEGIIKTGGQEENQVFCNLSSAQELSGRNDEINIVYLSMMGSSDQLQELGKRIEKSYSDISLSLIRRISQSEGLIINKIKLLLLLVTIIVLFSTFLCVGATMTAMTLERQKEIGLRKTLGARNRDILIEFLAETTFLGVNAGFFGYLAGFILVQVIGKSVFGSAISFRLIVIPITVVVSAAISSLAGLLPIRMALKIEPATVLRGE